MNACPRCGKMAVGVGEAIRGTGESVLACRQCGCALHFDERPLSGLALEAAVMLLAWLVLIISCLAWGYPLGRALSGIFVFPLVIALSFRGAGAAGARLRRSRAGAGAASGCAGCGNPSPAARGVIRRGGAGVHAVGSVGGPGAAPADQAPGAALRASSSFA
jgi:hypothetical protein